MRGGDLPYTPLPLSFAILHANGMVEWFVDQRKLTPGLGAHLGNEVVIAAPEAFGPALDALTGKRVRLDYSSAPAWAFDRLTQTGAKVARGADPNNTQLKLEAYDITTCTLAAFGQGSAPSGEPGREVHTNTRPTNVDALGSWPMASAFWPARYCGAGVFASPAGLRLERPWTRRGRLS